MKNTLSLSISGETLVIKPVRLKRLLFRGEGWTNEVHRLDTTHMKIVTDAVINCLSEFLKAMKTDAFSIIGSNTFSPSKHFTIFGTHISPIEVSDLLAS